MREPQLDVLKVYDRIWRWVPIGRPTECWDWQRSLDRDGYPQINAVNLAGEATTKKPHRVAWESLYGRIPADLTIDHLCRNRRCCNPAHLEPVTIPENTARGTAARLPHTHCRRGHEWTKENTYRPPGRTYRVCRECKNANARELYHVQNLYKRNGD